MLPKHETVSLRKKHIGYDFCRFITFIWHSFSAQLPLNLKVKVWLLMLTDQLIMKLILVEKATLSFCHKLDIIFIS